MGVGRRQWLLAIVEKTMVMPPHDCTGTSVYDSNSPQYTPAALDAYPVFHSVQFRPVVSVE